MRKPSVLVIFLTVFIDLIGFGIVVPLVPVYSTHFGAHGVVIGIIIASFSAMQFLFAPIWGRLSDRHGRRPILLISTAGAAGSYVLFALSSGMENHVTALWLMVLSRMFAGLCGGNITVAQAYIADITPPEERSKKMGLIGMAFGLGFIFGPFIGGKSLQYFGNIGPGWAAASLCAANFLLALFILTESRKPGSAQTPPRPHVEQWLHTMGQPKVGLLVVVFFLATFCFASFETTLGLLISGNFHLNVATHQDMKMSGYLIAYCGVIGAAVQGGAIGRMVKRRGEARLIANSLFLLAASLAPLPFIKGPGPAAWIMLLVVLAALAIGSSLTRPPVFGLISILTPPHEQGATIGVAQSAGSLARIIAPIFAAGLLVHNPPVPYLICSGISLVTAMLVVHFLCRDASPALGSEAANPAK